jgi:hypothetical protein
VQIYSSGALRNLQMKLLSERATQGGRARFGMHLQLRYASAIR